MRAVILAGGLGTRLRPYTAVLPKPLVPVGERPILEHMLHGLAGHGVTRVDLCVAHLGELIRVYFSETGATPQGMELRWHWEDRPLGTAGALQVVPDLEGTFLAMNGDILTNLDYTKLLDHHHSEEAALTVAVRRETVQVELGVIESANGSITAYREKPTLNYEVSMGIYAYDARALKHLPEGPCQFPELVERLVAAGERVAVFPASEVEWFDVGTLGQLERATARLQEFPERFAPPQPI